MNNEDTSCFGSKNSQGAQSGCADQQEKEEAGAISMFSVWFVWFRFFFPLVDPAESVVSLLPADLVSSLNMIYLLGIINVSCALNSN